MTQEDKANMPSNDKDVDDFWAYFLPDLAKIHEDTNWVLNDLSVAAKRFNKENEKRKAG